MANTLIIIVCADKDLAYSAGLPRSELYERLAPSSIIMHVSHLTSAEVRDMLKPMHEIHTYTTTGVK